MEQKEKIYLYLRENVFQSIVADVFSFGVLFGGMLLNRFVLNDSWYIYVFFMVLFLIVSAGRSSRRWKEFTNKEDLLEYLKSNS